jgi:D-tyrosyl-tRNA(Tyr) deacylase
VFEDAQGKMNRSLLDIGGELLVVSQFTLYANCRKGRRPGFDRSLEPKLAESFFGILIDKLRQSGLKVAAGRFGARMQVALVNDGPVTIMLDDEEILTPK